MRVLTTEEFEVTVRSWDIGRKVGLDLETNGLEPWHPAARIVGLSLAGYDTATGGVSGLYIPLGHQAGANADPKVLHAALTLLTLAGGVVPFYVAMEHSWLLRKFELALNYAGDAYILGRLLQLPELGLKDLTEAVLQRKVVRFEELVMAAAGHDFSVTNSDDPRIAEYGCADAVNGLQLEAVLRNRAASLGLLPVYQIELAAALVMAEEALAGYRVDSTVLDRQLAEETLRLDALEADLYQGLGGPSNLNSPVQLGKNLKAIGLTSPLRTDKGAESWSIEALELIAHQHPVVPKIVDYKRGCSLIAALKRAPLAPDEDGGLHPRWQTIQISGSSRMQCEKPALTSLPKPARKAFIAPGGFRWVQIEWRQPETRMVAALAKAESMRLALSTAGDAYEALAMGMYDRETMKHLLHCYLHGGHSLDYMADHLRVDKPEAQHRVAWLEACYPELPTFLAHVRQRVHTNGTVVSWMNRVRTLDTPKGGGDHELYVRACTAVGQQSVGTALKVVLSLLDTRRKMGQPTVAGIRHFIPVFDSVAYCQPMSVPLEFHLSAVVPLFELDLGVTKMAVTARTGPSWGELTEVAPEVWATVAEPAQWS